MSEVLIFRNVFLSFIEMGFFLLRGGGGCHFLGYESSLHGYHHSFCLIVRHDAMST